MFFKSGRAALRVCVVMVFVFKVALLGQVVVWPGFTVLHTAWPSYLPRLGRLVNTGYALCCIGKLPGILAWRYRLLITRYGKQPDMQDITRCCCSVQA
ncbi:hypothetical protein D9M68_463380 [compost metagenome]